MVSEGVWRVSGDASIPNVLAKNILDHDTRILLFSSSALYCIKMPMSWGA